MTWVACVFKFKFVLHTLFQLCFKKYLVHVLLVYEEPICIGLLAIGLPLFGNKGFLCVLLLSNLYSDKYLLWKKQML